NARGLLHRHPLGVPASPSLGAVRTLIGEADLVIAAGTEFGPTDYDMYGDGGFSVPDNLVRIDLDGYQLARHPVTVGLRADWSAALAVLGEEIATEGMRTSTGGVERALTARRAALAELEPAMREQIAFVETMRDALPGAIIVGDSTQPIYATNLYYDHDR